MTYRELINKLNSIPAERLDDEVTIYDGNNDEFVGIHNKLNVAKEDSGPAAGVLDPGHVYLKLS